MNPIEHAWDRLKRAVYGQLDPPTTLRDIHQITVEGWDNLGQQGLDELVDSMPRRIQACINASGRATGYWRYWCVLQFGPQLLKVYLYDGTPCNMWFS